MMGATYMRKILFVLLSVVFILGACGGNDEEKTQDDQKNNEQTQAEKDQDTSDSVEVDKGLLDVEVIIPASFFAGEDKEQVIAEAKEEGVAEVKENEDGSLTYKMSKSTHKEMMHGIEADLNDAIDEIKNDDEYASIQDITANDSYSEFTMVVDEEAFANSFDGFASLGLGILGLYYQLFDGVDPDDYDVKVHIEDADTGEVFDTIVYPDAFEDMEAE